MDLGFSRGFRQNAVTVIAGAAIFAAGLAGFSALQSGDPIQIKLSSFTWLASMKLELAQPLPAIELKTEAPMVFTPIPETEMSLAVAPPQMSKRKSHSRTRHVARRAPIQHKQDAIRTIAAAPIEPEYIDGVATQSQLNKFQGLNSLLRQQFFAGLEGRSLEAPTQFAQTDSDMTLASAIEYSAPKAKTPKKSTHKAPATQPTAQIESISLPAAPVPTPEPTFHRQLAQVNFNNLNSMAITAYDAPIGPQPLAIEVSRKPAVILNTQSAEEIRDQISRDQAQAEAARAQETEATHYDEAGSEAQVVATNEEVSSSDGSTEEAADRAPAKVTTQSTGVTTFQAAWSNLAKAGVASPAEYSPMDTQTQDPSQRERMTDWPKREPLPKAGYAAMLTQSSESKGWRIARAEDRWPTLVDAAVSPAPMVSNNAAMMLAAHQKVALQADTGMIFGKLPAGWSIKVSGRAERPIFLNTDLQFVGPEMVSGERDFIYLNTAPGTQVLGLVGPNGIDGGVVTIPVLGHTATYVDFTRQQRKTLTGVLLYGNDGEPIANAKVQIMGQPGGATWTNVDGEFAIPQVLAVGNLPIHLDVERPESRSGGKAHIQRFRLYGNAMEGQVLYALHEGQIRAWLEQLQGKINSETGMVVGAFKDIAESAVKTGKKYRPMVEPFYFNSNLSPETYVISDEGQLQVNTPLGAKDRMFLGLEISEGPVMTKIVADGVFTAWSDIVYAESNTVNVIYSAP